MHELGKIDVMFSEKVSAELTPKNKEREVFIFEFNG
jgi:hypothetical protein